MILTRINNTGPILASALIALSCTACSTSGGDSSAELVQAREKIRSLETEVQELKAKLASAGTGKSGDITAIKDMPQDSQKDSKGVSVGFTDLAETPTTQYIEDLGRLKVFDSNSGEFHPNETITRGEYVKWLYKAHNAIHKPDKTIYPAPTLKQQFKDLPPAHPAYKYAQALANAGYSVGYEDGTFKPDRPISREEMIVIKVGVDQGKLLKPWYDQMKNLWKFTDSDKVDKRYTGQIAADFNSENLELSNIYRAFGKTSRFQPKESARRHEAAATLWNFRIDNYYTTNAREALKRQQKEEQ